MYFPYPVALWYSFLFAEPSVGMKIFSHLCGKMIVGCVALKSMVIFLTSCAIGAVHIATILDE